ncbi:hypothetical protein [Brevundimonas sp.]|uniref:hypothetical protein n=1 Tax=Brevundimonas sp. TaxID=1871086 RepID=UPI002580A6E8|nr:hypothetical protein [Brevundimonas sp.]
MSKLLKITAAVVAPAAALALTAAPASAQSRARDDTARNPQIGAAVGGVRRAPPPAATKRASNSPPPPAGRAPGTPPRGANGS